MDIRQRLRQEAVVEVARMKQCIEGGSRWHGRGRLVKRVHSKEVIGRRPRGKPRKGWKDNFKYRMAGNFGGKIFWRIAEIMTFGGIYFGG